MSRLSPFFLALLVSGCSHTQHKGRDTAKDPASSENAEVADEASAGDGQQGYLDAVHEMIRHPWQEIIKDATRMLPPEHPLNDLQRVAEMEVGLGSDGRRLWVRISRGSGCSSFDETALLIISSVDRFPPLPQRSRRSQGILRWRFYRDARSCRPAYASLEVRTMSPEEAMSQALELNEINWAIKILMQHPGRESLLPLVAEAGLQAGEIGLFRSALKLVPAQQLMILLERELSPARWQAVIDVMVRQKRTADLLAHLLKMVESSNGTKSSSGQQADLDGTRTASLLEALHRLEARLPERLTALLLADRRPKVVVAAADIVQDPARLDPVIEAWEKKPEVYGPLAVIKRSLGPFLMAEELIDSALAGPGCEATLEAFARHPVAELEKVLTSLINGRRRPMHIRLRAIELAARSQSSRIPLFLALRSRDPEIQIAAAQALASHPGNEVSTSYRLTDLAYRSTGMVSAVALASIARIGHERFLQDVLIRYKRLDAASRAIVVSSLWGFGEIAVPALSRLLSHQDIKLQRASLQGLSRIPGKKAAEAMKLLRGESPDKKIEQRFSSPLEELVQRAVLLSSTEPRPTVRTSG